MFRWRWLSGWTWPSRLRKCGVLGMNCRNAAYVLATNPRCHYPRVDDKLLTKQLCRAHGIPVPRTYGVIRCQSDIRRLGSVLDNHQEFVIKPTGGSEGRGILVVTARDGAAFVTAGGDRLFLRRLGVSPVGGSRGRVLSRRTTRLCHCRTADRSALRVRRSRRRWNA